MIAVCSRGAQRVLRRATRCLARQIAVVAEQVRRLDVKELREPVIGKSVAHGEKQILAGGPTAFQFKTPNLCFRRRQYHGIVFGTIDRIDD